MVPDQHTVLQAGDLVHVMVADVDISDVERTLNASPESER